MRARTLAFAAVAFFSCSKEPTKRQIIGLRALEDGSALVLTESATGTEALARVNGAGRIVWRRDLDGVAQQIQADRGILLTRGAVALRTLQYENGARVATVEMFSLDGKRLQTTKLGPVAKTEGVAAGLLFVTGYAIEDTFFVVFESVGTFQVVALDGRNGREIHRAPLPFEPDGLTYVRGDTALVDDGRRTASIRIVDAKLVVRLEPIRCAGNGWTVIERDDRTYQLETATGTYDLQSGVLSIEQCREHRDRIVLVFERYKASEIQIRKGNGELLAKHELEWDLSSGYNERFHSKRGRGPVPRFLPIFHTISTPLEARREELVMFDLEQGVIAWRVAVPRVPLVFREGDYWFFTGGARSEHVAVIDGRTGTLTAAKSLGPRFVGAATLSPTVLWTYEQAWTEDIRSQITRLDPTTLTQQGGAKLPMVDVSSSIPYDGIPRR